MRHYFIDSDVIIDFLGHRKPFSRAASRIFIQAKKKELKLYASSNSITITYYILCKTMPEKTVRELMPVLLKYVFVIPVTEHIINEAALSEMKDFEDAIQHYCALSEPKIEAIITRNVKDFKKSRLPVLNSADFIVSY